MSEDEGALAPAVQMKLMKAEGGKQLHFNPHETKRLAMIHVSAMGASFMQGLGLGGLRVETDKLNYGGVSLHLKSFPDPVMLRSLEETCKHFEVDPAKGLDSSKLDDLLTKYGTNSLKKAERRTKWEIFKDQFEDLLVIMLLVAAAVAFGIAMGTGADWREYVAPIFICLIVLANAYMGMEQEGKADDAVEALDNQVQTKVNVMRNGQVETVDAALIFPGDILLMDLGGVLPADCQIISCSSCSIEEKIFTGEPDAIKKKVTPPATLAELPKWAKSNIAYKGCPIATGNMKGVVIGTGMNTRMGEISRLLSEVEDELTPLQQKLDDLGQVLGYSSLSISIVVFVIGVAAKRGGSPDSAQPLWLQMLLIAVSLTVAAVPEGLPVCTTISLASGMSSMAKQNAIVKTLKSVETLGQASIICSDKTGTLTKGEMTVIGMRTWKHTFATTGTGYSPEGTITSTDPNAQNSPNFLQCLAVAAVCNGAVLFKDESGRFTASGNLTDRAMLVLSKKAPKFQAEIYKNVFDNPFDSDRKMMSKIVECTSSENPFPSGKVALVKGAPDYVLKKVTQKDDDGAVSDMSESEKGVIMEQVKEYSRQGNRVIALCYTVVGDNLKTTEDGDENPYHHSYVEKNLIYIGLVACVDPAREDVPDAIKKAQGAGVKVVMITGDYKETAENIAKQIGIVQTGGENEKVIDCGDLHKPGLTHDEKVALIKSTVVFSRAQPEDKIAIIEVLQGMGGVVAMTGDGVNDSPALKKADIGIAMGITGTEAAKAAADMILTDDSFASIVRAIEEGRRIFCNIQKFVFYLLSTNVSEVFSILLAVMIGVESPLVPVQILWLNFITDGLPALALAFEGLEAHVMLAKPMHKRAPIIDRTMLVKTFFHTIVLTGICLGAYLWALDHYTGKWNGRPSPEPAHLHEGIIKSQTVVMVVIVWAELLRAYASRSSYYSIFQLGFFTNKWMVYSVVSGIILHFAVSVIPIIQDIFGMRMLDGKSWAFVIGVCWLPFFTDEVLKFFQRRYWPIV